MPASSPGGATETDPLAAPTPVAATDPHAPERAQAEARANSGANWVSWIAGLSIANSLSALTGSKWGLVIGLGTTQVVDALVGGALEDAGTARVVAPVLDVNVALVFACFGRFARRRYLWAFYVGLVCYGLDALLFLLAKDVLSIVFHGFALYCVYSGLRATRRLAALAPPAASARPGPVPPGGPPLRP